MEETGQNHIQDGENGAGILRMTSLPVQIPNGVGPLE